MAKPPYDPEALPPDLRSLIPQHYLRSTPNPAAPSPEQKSVVTPNGQTKAFSQKSYVPVMFCQTAEGGLTKPLVRGAAPSTPRHRRKESRRRTALMFFRCTPEERTTIETNAASAGLEKSSYIRAQSTGKPVMRAYRRVRADWDELRRCMGVINKAGNVVNQLIVMLRRAGGNPETANTALIELAAAARDICDALREV